MPAGVLSVGLSWGATFNGSVDRKVKHSMHNIACASDTRGHDS